MKRHGMKRHKKDMKWKDKENTFNDKTWKIPGTKGHGMKRHGMKRHRKDMKWKDMENT